MNNLSLNHQQNPNDIAYVHSGYAPLSVRLVQFLERQSGWRGMEELLRNIPGHTVEEKQDIPPALVKKGKFKSSVACLVIELRPKCYHYYFFFFSFEKSQ